MVGWADYFLVSPDDGPGARGALPFEVRLLGPVQVVRAAGEVALGGPRPRAVLALLVLEAGRVVPAGRLIEEAWRGRPPPGAAATLRSYVSRLRGALAPEAALAARGGGYVLGVDPGAVDAVRFEGLAASGQAVLQPGEAARRRVISGQALGLWRGRALADVGEVEPLAREAARLEELRLVVVEGRIEADIGLGLHAEVIGELEGLAGEYPLRERLWGLLVLALYRAGRQADALAAYRRARDMLAPSWAWNRGGAAAAGAGGAAAGSPGGGAARQHNLPGAVDQFPGPRAGSGPGREAAGPGAAGHADRDRRDRQDPAGGGGRGAAGGPVPGRGVAGRTGRRRRARAGGRAGDGRAGGAAGR